MNERLYDVSSVAARYGRTITWVYRCADLKKISFKVGKYLHWRESDLIALEEYRSTSRRGFDLKHFATVMRPTSTNRQQAREPFKLSFDIL